MFGNAHDILRLKVKVNDRFAVHVVDALAYLLHEPNAIRLFQLEIIIYYSFE